MDNQQEHQVYRQLERINELLSLANNYLDELEKKLAPIIELHPVTAVSNEKGLSTLVPLASSFSDSADNLGRIVERILDITNSVRL